MTSSRPYDSPTRKENAALTRQRIIEALIDLLVEERPATISIPAVARRANVSVRTVYHHFPTKELLFDALPEASRFRGDLSDMPDPTSPKEVAERAAEVFAYFERNEALFNAMRMSDASQHVSASLDRRAVTRAEAMVSPLNERLEKEDLRRLQALLGSFVSYDMYRALTRRYGLSIEDAAGAVSWAVTVLADRAKRTGRVGTDD